MSDEMNAAILRNRAGYYRRIAELPDTRLADWRKSEVIAKAGYQYGKVPPNLVGSDLRFWLNSKARDFERMAGAIEVQRRKATEQRNAERAELLAQSPSECCGHPAERINGVIVTDLHRTDCPALDNALLQIGDEGR